MNLMPRDRRVRIAGTIIVLAASLAIASCGGGDNDDPEPRPEGITHAEGRSVALGTPRDQLDELLHGEQPILIEGPNPTSPNGCIHYAMQDQPLVSTWLFCFNARDRVRVSGTLFSDRPELEGAAPARVALVGRGDVTCEVENGKLAGTTEKLGKALAAFGRDESGENREAVGRLLEKFVEPIERTADELARFEAPEEERDALLAYIDALRSQAEKLSDAREAFLEGDLDTYNQLGEESNEFGAEAREQAEQYGFIVCGASTFG